jgi:monoamine oxidase
MAPLSLTHFVIVGAGAAGLMTARELARAGKKVTILEARDRYDGRIYPLPAQEFGYPAEGGADSLTEIFNLPLHHIKRDLITSQAINWGLDVFARGAYSYATRKTREAQTALRKSDARAVFFSGEALYAGRDMGTVEAALANGVETAQAILTAR